jgi:hypothetical protein
MSLRDQIADELGKHRPEAKSRTDACPDFPGFLTWHDGCICGWTGKYLHDEDQWDQHHADAVTDLLIDLAGTGRLLASISEVTP